MMRVLIGTILVLLIVANDVVPAAASDAAADGQKSAAAIGAAGRCCESVLCAIQGFLEAVAISSLNLVRKVIPPGVQPESIFGNGDADLGWRVIMRLRANETFGANEEQGSVEYELARIENGAAPLERVVTIAKVVEVVRWEGDVERYLRTEVFWQKFVVTFDLERNCILRIDPIGDKWIKGDPRPAKNAGLALF
ncbi:hypothetical protein C4552_03385 [Candidatus Parcubacteria bacterium]|nr:MAG: hypothetical protein C4552_03385 [Candidatus Parcubacteria bacterium]